MKEALIKRIEEYLSGGGLFNPEMANHIAVRDLLIECRIALAQPEQEPVATLDDLEQEIYENTRQFVSRDVMEWMLKRYYTTPPQRKPLTDEEIWQLVNDCVLGGDLHPDKLARIIEAKLKEKNT